MIYIYIINYIIYNIYDIYYDILLCILEKIFREILEYEFLIFNWMKKPSWLLYKQLDACPLMSSYT